MVNPAGKYPALVGKEQNMPQYAGYHHIRGIVLGSNGSGTYAFATAALGSVGVQGQSFNIAAVG